MCIRDRYTIVQQVVAQLPWGHNVQLLDSLHDHDERLWYAEQAVENGWSRAVMKYHIDTDLRSRIGRAPNNFATTLPPVESDLVAQTFKDPYIIDFLATVKYAHERYFENDLIEQVSKFLRELGTGFSFIGKQHPLSVGGQDFFIDLLFYHYRLHRFVVIDLKMDHFTPQDAGQMNFYVNVVDKQLRSEHDGMTIGLILCPDRNSVIVENSLAGMATPIAVSQYRINRPDIADALPPEEKIDELFDKLIADDQDTDDDTSGPRM